MKTRTFFRSLLGAIFIPGLLLPDPAASQPDADAARLREIPARMQAFVDDGTIAGAVTLVGRGGAVAALDTVGFADLDSETKMRKDQLFWIASMTKPMTAAAVMMLVDKGKLNVDDPVEKHLPEFKGQWLVSNQTAKATILVRPPRPITIRDLLTHSSGLDNVAPPRPDCSLAELVMAYSQRPLKFAPGTKWEYCNSGINTLGRLVEVVSDQPFAIFMKAHLFKPLGMQDTTFWPVGADLRRVATSYEPGADGKLKETGIFFITSPLDDTARTPMPAGGLFSTAEDVFRFYAMMLNGGEWKGRRILSKESVDAMTRTQSGDLKTGFTDGMSWGFGFGVVREPQGVTAVLSPGAFGHGGAYGTQSWADPKTGMVYILMIQRAKLPNADASDVRRVFQDTASAAFR